MYNLLPIYLSVHDFWTLCGCFLSNRIARVGSTLQRKLDDDVLSILIELG